MNGEVEGNEFGIREVSVGKLRGMSGGTLRGMSGGTLRGDVEGYQ